MANKVISLDAARLEKTPHMAGEAVCLICKYKWSAVAETGSVWLECPKCGVKKGLFIYECDRDEKHWECKCENQLFYITPKGPYCPNCGAWQEIPIE